MSSDNKNGSHITTPTGKKLSKVDRYKWEVIDEPGGIGWISKTKLNVDKDYQREHVYERRVLEIAAAWSWKMCGVLMVAQRPDGTYWVFDGQHRKLAADRRDDIRELPCIVFKTQTIAEEATAFVDVNSKRTVPSSVDKFRASLVAGNRTASAVREMIEAAGYKASTANCRHTVRCIKQICDAFDSDQEACKFAWDLCVKLHDGEAIYERIFGGIFYLERWLRRRDMTLLAKGYVASLFRAGMSGIRASIAEAASYHSGGGMRIWAIGVARVVNKNRSSNRIPEAEIGEKG
jgi:hypothetical protein